MPKVITKTQAPEVVNLRRHLAQIFVTGRRVKKDLIAKIIALPDNPRIQRLGDTPKCFVVMFSDLGDNWTPAHHDFKYQYKLLAKELSRRSVERAWLFLKKAVWQGHFIESGAVNGQGKLNFHADVLKYLMELTGFQNKKLNEEKERSLRERDRFSRVAVAQ